MPAFALAAAALCSAACGGGGSECAVDTDCAGISERCSNEGRCVPIGVDDAGEVDARVPEAGMDGGVPDAGRDAANDAAQDAPLDAGGARLGVVFATSSNINDMPSFSVSAGFRIETGETDPRCSTETIDSCQLTTCEPRPAPDAGTPDGGAADAGTGADAGAPAPPPTAGAIVVEGARTVTLEDPADGTYDTAQGDGILWSPPEELTVTALGAEVPSFSASLATPDMVTVERPDMSMEPVSLSKSEPLFEWQGVPAPGSVVVSLSWSGERDASVGLQCLLEAVEPPVTLPIEALSPFPTGETGNMTVHTANRVAVDAGEGWAVTVWAIAPAVRIMRVELMSVPAEASVTVLFEE